MYLSNVQGSKTAKFVAILTLFAVIISLFPVSAFAEEDAETVTPLANTAQSLLNQDENHLEVTICHSAGQSGNYTLNTVDDDSIVGDDGHGAHENDIIPPFGDFNGLNWDAEGQAIWNNDCEVPDNSNDDHSGEACEIEGHKYDDTAHPLSNWTIGLMKVLTFSDRTESHDVATDVTNDDGYFCLEWDGYTGTTPEEEPHTFSYRVYEVLKAGWNYFKVEENADYRNLKRVADADVEIADGRVSVQIGEENGYIYADAEHHVDFYNTEIDPCDEEDNDTVNRSVVIIDQDPCDDDDDSTDTIGGYKFNDKNGNGEWDDEEPAIAGWEINLMQGDSIVMSNTTDEDGYYEFEVENGSYKVSETQQEGWEQTATIGENADGDYCYITVGLQAAPVTKIAVDTEDSDIEDNTCTFGNKEIIVTPICETGKNLLVNGSFEDPSVEEGDWDIFSTVAGWTIALSDGLELWANGFYGGASDGNQNAELDGNAPTKITQNVTTVPGATYELRFDFSARPDADSTADNNVDGLVNGLAIMNAVANGSDITTNTWSTHSQTFVATGTSTEIGLVDNGTANSLGSLIDNAVLCLVSTPNGGGDDDGGDDDTPNRGGGGSSTRVKRTPTGEVLGASTSTPTGMVLGEATSTLPVGAPNTGAGGTSPVVVQLPTFVAVLPKAEKIK